MRKVITKLNKKTKNMGFVEELLKEQEQLLTDELRFAEGEEFIETGNRLTDVKNALIKLGLCVVSQQRELLLAYERSQYETTWWMSEAEATNRINDFLANNCG